MSLGVKLIKLWNLLPNGNAEDCALSLTKVDTGFDWNRFGFGRPGSNLHLCSSRHGFGLVIWGWAPSSVAEHHQKVPVSCPGFSEDYV